MITQTGHRRDAPYNKAPLYQYLLFYFTHLILQVLETSINDPLALLEVCIY